MAHRTNLRREGGEAGNEARGWGDGGKGQAEGWAQEEKQARGLPLAAGRTGQTGEVTHLCRSSGKVRPLTAGPRGSGAGADLLGFTSPGRSGLGGSGSFGGNLFRYMSGGDIGGTAGPPAGSPYAMSPVGDEGPLGACLASPRRPPRKIARTPFKVLDAPALQVVGGCAPPPFPLFFPFCFS